MSDNVRLLLEQTGLSVCNLTASQCREIADEIERLRALIVKKDEALKPFADAAEGGIDIDDNGEWSAWEQPCSMDVIVDDFRRTVYALALTPDDLKDCVVVPMEPTEKQWSGLARDIVMWLRMHNGNTPRNLFKHLERIGREIPQWLRDEQEMKALDHAISKSTIAVIIYRAMIRAGKR